jgi:hypothetical protein
MWKDSVEPAREAPDGNIPVIRGKKDAICMPDNWGKNTDTQSEYLLRIAFPRQQLLRERASILGCITLPVLLYN